MGATACGGKADSTSMPHSSTNMKVWGGALSTWNTINNWGLRNIPWADVWSVGSRYWHNIPGLRCQESPADVKNWLFLLCYLYWNSWYEIWLCFTVDVGTSRPKACCHCPFNKRAVLNWFLCAISAGNLSWDGVEQGGDPEWVRALWEPVSRKRGMASPTTALMQHKSTAIRQWEKNSLTNATIWTLFEETN